jgi:RNA polymerase sigma-70 factor (ECF subfamily)
MKSHEEDWIRVYRDNVRALYAFALRRAGGEKELAEDVTQEAFLRALDTWQGTFPSEPQAWLRAVARNLLCNHFRRIQPPAVAADALDLEQPSEPATPDAAAVLHWGLARLKSGQARLIEAHHLDGKTTRVIADELGLSERAVEGRLRRSRLALRQHLSPYYSAAEEA